jgi:hypothetical protein
MLVYPCCHARLESTNPTTPQLSPNQKSHQKLPTKSPNDGCVGATSNKTVAQPPHKSDTVANATNILPTPQQYLLGMDKDLLHSSMEDDSIPSTAADSACTSRVGSADDTCWYTGQASNKQFVLPGSKIKQATKVAGYPFKVQEPARELHITPGITKDLLLSTGKFATTNYTTIFDKEEVNIYDANTPSLQSQEC